MQKIYPCLWFENQAEDAAKLYTTLFKNSRIDQIARYGESGAKVSGKKKGEVMTIDFEIENQRVMGLNGGPLFKFTPALSFFVSCDSEKEITDLWQNLSKGGEVRMGLDKYPWAEKYGWTRDRFGVEWQLMLTSNRQKIAPAFLFVDKLFGKGEEAMNFYMSLFKNSGVLSMSRDENTKTIQHCVFNLAGQEFALMEGPGTHNYTFSLAYSFVVNCESQDEVDYFWNKLSNDPAQEQCGWLMDKYGVSWQIVPNVIGKMMSDPDPVKAEKVMSAMLKMKKLDIKTLELAYRS